VAGQLGAGFKGLLGVGSEQLGHLPPVGAGRERVAQQRLAELPGGQFEPAGLVQRCPVVAGEIGDQVLIGVAELLRLVMR
jgi:hypothetical protein